MLQRQLHEPATGPQRDSVPSGYDARRASLSRAGEGGFEVIGALNRQERQAQSERLRGAVQLTPKIGPEARWTGDDRKP